MEETLIMTKFLTGGGGKTAHRRGFTLAEVLITLGIIGIVAAMTLPALQQKIQYKKYETGFKVAENLLHNAVNYFHSKEKMINGETYCTANPGNEDSNFCKDGQYEVFSEVLAEAFIGIHALNKNGIGGYAANKYYNFKNNTKFAATLLDDGYMELANGMSVIIESGSNTTLPIIFFDVNGTANKPNRMGYDTFAFVIDKNDRVCPLGSSSCKGRSSYIETTSDFTKSKYCSPASSSDNNGITCGYFASIDKDYFKKIK